MDLVNVEVRSAAPHADEGVVWLLPVEGFPAGLVAAGHEGEEAVF